MFDIGFSEILLVAVVALVVIGPERLPGVARNVGRYAGRLQRYVHDIKRDFNREVEFEEIKRLQHEMETTVQSMQESMRAVETTLQQETLKHQADLSAALSADEKPAAVKKSKPVLAQAPAATESTADPKPKEDQLSLF
ncbi:MAG: Sec-independent protein translocase protein TatB [Fluviibacter sp.]